jgi:hypothetical protein
VNVCELKLEYNRAANRPIPEEYMPVLSKFYGIVIRMFFASPLVEHFHAIYRDHELVVGLSPLRILDGDAPRRVKTMVLEWAAQHREELLDAWNSCRVAIPPLPIQPLE